MSRARSKWSPSLPLFLYLALGLAFHLRIATAQSSSGDNPATNSMVTPSYFPAGSLDESKSTWLTKKLQASAEPSLLDSSDQHGGSSFRLIQYALTTKSRLQIIRLEIGRDGDGIIFTKRVSPDGKITLNKQDKVSPEQINAFLTVVKQSGFWSLPTEHEVEAVEQRQTRDAGVWFLEGFQDHTYHIAYRRNLTPGPFMD